MKATNEEIVAAYKETGSVWVAAKRLGMAGQTVHERLRALQYPMAARKWSADEIEELRALAGHMTLGEIGHQLGRPYAGVACKISELGIGTRYGNRIVAKIPRGAGYDKASCKKYARQIDESQATVHAFARRNGLGVETLCRALEVNLPGWWDAYRRDHSELPETNCPYCERKFVPSTKKQQFCSRKCSSDSRTDREYFGGNRRLTIGLAEQRCQLCGREGLHKLSSHHMRGKENDPDNLWLIALCSGCHDVVTRLGGRHFVDDPIAWESLISLVLTRKHGADDLYKFGTYVVVEFEPLTEEEADSM